MTPDTIFFLASRCTSDGLFDYTTDKSMSYSQILVAGCKTYRKVKQSSYRGLSHNANIQKSF